MKKLSGWQKAGLIAGVVCFSFLVLIAIGVVVAVLWARSTLAQLGDTTPTRVERTIAVGDATSAAAGPSAAAQTQAAGKTTVAAIPLRLTIDLEEASFTIRPGSPGGQVQVQGTSRAGTLRIDRDSRQRAGRDTAVDDSVSLEGSRVGADAVGTRRFSRSARADGAHSACVAHESGAARQHGRIAHRPGWTDAGRTQSQSVDG